MRFGVLACAIVLAVSSRARADDRAQMRAHLIEAINQRDYPYKPYVVAGTAIPVCTAVTFIYSQR